MVVISNFLPQNQIDRQTKKFQHQPTTILRPFELTFLHVQLQLMNIKAINYTVFCLKITLMAGQLADLRAGGRSSMHIWQRLDLKIKVLSLLKCHFFGPKLYRILPYNFKGTNSYNMEGFLCTIYTVCTLCMSKQQSSD